MFRRIFKVKKTVQGSAGSSLREKLSKPGLHIIHEGQSGPNADILFIHGPFDNAYDTWFHSNSQTFWPAELLPLDVPSARVMVFAYHESPYRSYDPVAKKLVESLAQLRIDTHTKCRDLYIVAHSIGGLIAKRAIQKPIFLNKDPLRELQYNVRGVFFFGTPHHRVNPIELADALNGTDPNVRWEKPDIALINPQEVFDTQFFFEQWLILQDKKRRSVEVIAFHEKRSKGKEIVPLEAALPIDSRPWPTEAIFTSHKDMCKFWGKNDDGYCKFLSGLQQYINLHYRSRIQASLPPAAILPA